MHYYAVEGNLFWFFFSLAIVSFVVDCDANTNNILDLIIDGGRLSSQWTEIEMLIGVWAMHF